MDGTFLTPAQVCERFKGTIDIRTLANWRSSGSGPPYTKAGGRVLYPIAALEEWERGRTVQPTARKALAG